MELDKKRVCDRCKEVFTNRENNDGQLKCKKHDEPWKLLFKPESKGPNDKPQEEMMNYDIALARMKNNPSSIFKKHFRHACCDGGLTSAGHIPCAHYSSKIL